MEKVPVILPVGIPVTYPSEHGVLKLVATNIIFGKLKDEHGKEKGCWTSALSMMIGEDRETMKAYKVHAGKSVQLGKFTVNILRIDRSRSGMVVMADIVTVE